MRSRTSLYNIGFGKNLLRRFWPLWALWLAVLLMMSLSVAGISRSNYYLEVDFLNTLHRTLLETGLYGVYFAMIAGALMAMAMLSYLYSPRSCGMISALPMTRTEAYATAALTGLVPMLIADLIAWLVMLAVCGGVPGMERTYLSRWLAMVVLSNTAFYGFALFCGVLTGNVLVLPAVYVVLGCTSYVAEAAVRDLLAKLVYGYTYSEYLFGFLSPIAHVFNTLNIRMERQPGGSLVRDAAALPAHFKVSGLGYLAAICAAGLLLAVLAALILKKRHMESAGEIVAVPVLRPLFRICMAVGCGIVFACVMCEWFVGNLFRGRALAAAAVVLLSVGAALGWFIAEMLMKKTLRVFDHGWKQIGIIAACLAALALLAEFDVTGYERHVPDPDEVTGVVIQGVRSTLHDRESIEAYCTFHRGMIAGKDENETERSLQYWTLPLTYELRDGSRFTRLYYIVNDERAQQNPDSDLMRYEKLGNLPECIRLRVLADREIGETDILNAYVNVNLYDEARGGWRSDTLVLTREQAAALYHEAVLPDAEAGNIGRWFVGGSPDSRALESNVSIYYELTPSPNTDFLPLDAGPYYYAATEYGYLSLNILLSAANSIRWLEDNLSITPESQYAMDPQSIVPVPTFD